MFIFIFAVPPLFFVIVISESDTMIEIVQFGEGNFLRAFADSYFNALNEEGVEECAVYIVKPAPLGTLD